MRRGSKLTVMLLLGVFAAGVLAAGALAAGTSKASRDAQIVHRLFPGATIVFTHVRSGKQLTIKLGAGALPPRHASGRSIIYNEIGWRAELAASAVNAQDHISRYQVTGQHGGVPGGPASNNFHGGFYSPPGNNARPKHPQLDTLSPSLAQAQLGSNLAVFEHVMPKGSVTSSSLKLIAVGPGPKDYAVEVDVTLSKASDLKGHYGDAAAGLETGFAGGGISRAQVEGTAVVVTGPDGHLLLGGWYSARMQAGTLALGQHGPTAARETTKFPDLTGYRTAGGYHTAVAGFGPAA